MRIRLHSRVIKFLGKLDKEDRERVRLKLKSLLSSVEAKGYSLQRIGYQAIRWRVEGFCENADRQDTDHFPDQQRGGTASRPPNGLQGGCVQVISASAYRLSINSHKIFADSSVQLSFG